MLSEHQLLLRATAAALRRRHYAARTVTIYVDWTRRFLAFFHHRPVAALDPAAADAYLSYLARERAVALSTQRQAQSALRFFYRIMLRRPLSAASRAVRPAAPGRPPTLLAADDASRLFRALSPTYRLPLQLIYGCGLRLHEVRRLQNGALDLERRWIAVAGRRAPIPYWLLAPLRDFRALWRIQQRRDAEQGIATGHDLLFPSPRLVWDETQQAFTRRPLHASTLSKQLRRAARRARLAVIPTCHDLRASCAAGLLAAGWEQPAVARLLGHRRARSVRRLLAATTLMPSPQTAP